MYEKEKKWNETTKKLWVLVLILNFANKAIKFLNPEGKYSSCCLGFIQYGY